VIEDSEAWVGPDRAARAEGGRLSLVNRKGDSLQIVDQKMVKLKVINRRGGVRRTKGGSPRYSGGGLGRVKGVSDYY